MDKIPGNKQSNSLIASGIKRKTAILINCKLQRNILVYLYYTVLVCIK